jgi:hypothetical protein
MLDAVMVAGGPGGAGSSYTFISAKLRHGKTQQSRSPTNSRGRLSSIRLVASFEI